jgi:alpha-1,2-mannosyltransferase
LIGFPGLARASARLTPLYALALLAIFTFDVVHNVRAGIFGADFHGTIWQAGRDILHGRSPYPAPNVAALAHAGNPAVYPAATVVIFSPLSLLPATGSAALWSLSSVFALFAALRIVGVRDWRVYTIVFLSFPVAASLELGQLDAWIAFGCALLWRWRNMRGARLAICLAVVVVAKVFLWPLLIWLAASGRRREAIGAALGAAVLAVAGWATIGFAGFAAYPRLLSSLTYAFGTKGYSLMALGTRSGLSAGSARLLPIVALVGLCGLCFSYARRGREEDAFIAAVAAGILGSPILWLHYVVILMVAMAAKKPALSAAWVVPIAFWLTPTENPPSGLYFAIGLCLLLLLLAVALRAAERARGRAPDATLRAGWPPEPAMSSRR